MYHHTELPIKELEKDNLSEISERIKRKNKEKIPVNYSFPDLQKMNVHRDVDVKDLKISDYECKSDLYHLNGGDTNSKITYYSQSRCGYCDLQYDYVIEFTDEFNPEYAIVALSIHNVDLEVHNYKRIDSNKIQFKLFDENKPICASSFYMQPNALIFTFEISKGTLVGNLPTIKIHSRCVFAEYRHNLMREHIFIYPIYDKENKKILATFCGYATIHDAGTHDIQKTRDYLENYYSTQCEGSFYMCLERFELYDNGILLVQNKDFKIPNISKTKNCAIVKYNNCVLRSNIEDIKIYDATNLLLLDYFPRELANLIMKISFMPSGKILKKLNLPESYFDSFINFHTFCWSNGQAVYQEYIGFRLHDNKKIADVNSGHYKGKIIYAKEITTSSVIFRFTDDSSLTIKRTDDDINYIHIVDDNNIELWRFKT